MIIGISGQNTNLMALIIQYVIYCDQMTKKHPTFTYPVEKFIKHMQRPDYSLVEDTGWLLKSFDYKIKQCASIILDIPIEKFEDNDFLDSSLPSYWVRYFYTDHKGKKRKTDIVDPNSDFYISEVMTVREFLQSFSIDACVNSVHTNFWTNAMFNSYIKTHTSKYEDQELILIYNPIFDKGSEHLFNYPNWIIVDVDNIFQADSIVNRGGIVIGVYPLVENLIDYIFNGTIDSTTNIIYIIQQIKQLLIKLKII